MFYLEQKIYTVIKLYITENQEIEFRKFPSI